MEESIINFNKQFEYDPIIRDVEKLKNNYKHFIICGMGGSHLAAGILKMALPGIELYVHRDYNLPPFDEEFLKNSLLIASSHSGNTEEVISFLKLALLKGYDTAIITTGGQLFELAVSEQIPHIIIPDEDIEPRLALGYSTLALAEILGEKELVKELNSLAKKIDPKGLKKEADSIAGSINHKIPIIYASNKNLPVVYNWKIKFNETAKTPAFYNIFPELNHNEMQSFDDESNNDKFHFIFIHDSSDFERVEKRMKITSGMLEERGYVVTNLELFGSSVLEKIFNNLLIADWVALNIANLKNKNPQAVLMIEDFKNKLNS